jgi:pyruvate dehydrogenase E1 component subunit alpha
MSPSPQQTSSETASTEQLGLLREMLRVRRFEEKCAELYSAAKIRGFMHLYIGEEAVAVGVMQALCPGDNVVTTYREHGHALARGIPASSLLAEMFGKVEGCSRGRGGSMHVFDVRTRFYGGNAIVGGGLPLAAGLALADRMRAEPRVTVCFFGDGAVAEGEFHETMNLSALWQLPVLLALKAAAYEMPAWPVDGMDVSAVASAATRAAEAVRGGGGPHFLELRTYRFRAHSMYDPDLYRDKAEVEGWRHRDPIPALISRLEAEGVLGAGDLDGMEAAIAKELADAEVDAEAGSLEPVDDLTRFVYSEVHP